MRSVFKLINELAIVNVGDLLKCFRGVMDFCGRL